MSIEELLSSRLNSFRREPLYIQLAAQIKGLIQSGELAVGDLLPSEPELCEKLGISRSTVRQSLSNLESEGYVIRRRGKGTYVSKPKVKRRVSRLCSFSNQMKEQGIASTSRVLSFGVLSSEDVPDLHGVSGDVYKIVRLRETDGQPFMIDTVYVPVKLAPSIKKADLADRSLYDIIEEKTGNAPQHALETYEVVKLGKNEAKLLQTENKAAFLVKRTSRLLSGELFELATMLIRGDRCRLEASLESDTVAFSRTIQR